MFIEMLDLLRCPGAHEETWLVAALERVEGRVVIEGRLGCPTCGASYPITSGAARFGETSGPTTPFDTWRVAALLDLRTPGRTVVLIGCAAELVDELVTTFRARVVFVGDTSRVAAREDVAPVEAADVSALRSAIADGVLIGAAGIGSDTGQAARVLRSGGRLILPAAAPPPTEFDEVAADDEQRVLQKRAVSAPVSLTRG